MDKVSKKTQEAYEELINYLSRDKKSTIAITPIFTVGGAIFDHFERDENKNILINPIYNTPEVAKYFFKDIKETKPTPKYCEQPAIYVLSYLMLLAEQKKKANYEKSNIWGKFIIKFDESIFKAMSDKDYKEQKDIILTKLKKSDDGYTILQNPVNF